jgi:hypothetical protein
MALHLIKLAVGVNDLAHMKKVQAARRKQRRQSPRSPHWVYTRNTPRRADELLAGGSLYWVVRGVIRCRQELIGFEEDFDEDNGKKFCRIKVRRPLVPTAPRTCKAFQGWRYFEEERVSSAMQARLEDGHGPYVPERVGKHSPQYWSALSTPRDTSETDFIDWSA